MLPFANYHYWTRRVSHNPFGRAADVQKAAKKPLSEWSREVEEAGPWVEDRLHELRHGQEKKFLAELANLKVPKGEAGKTVVEQQNYFQNQSERLAYKEIFKR